MTQKSTKNILTTPALNHLAACYGELTLSRNSGIKRPGIRFWIFRAKPALIFFFISYK